MLIFAVFTRNDTINIHDCTHIHVCTIQSTVSCIKFFMKMIRGKFVWFFFSLYKKEMNLARCFCDLEMPAMHWCMGSLRKGVGVLHEYAFVGHIT